MEQAIINALVRLNAVEVHGKKNLENMLLAIQILEAIAAEEEKTNDDHEQ